MARAIAPERGAGRIRNHVDEQQIKIGRLKFRSTS